MKRIVVIFPFIPRKNRKNFLYFGSVAFRVAFLFLVLHQVVVAKFTAATCKKETKMLLLQ